MWDQYLRDIDNVLWIGYGVCFLIWMIKDRTVNSFLISFGIVVCFNGIMYLSVPYLYSTTDSVDINRFIWYFTFALIDVIAVVLLLKVHKILNIKLDKNGLAIATLFILLMFFQFFRYVDRQILGTDLLGDVYKFGIPTINIATLLFLAYTVSTHGNSRRISSV